MTAYRLKTNRAYHAHGGFTLIELMVAVTILSVVIAIVYASFSSVADATEAARQAAARLRMEQRLARSFVHNLTQAQEGWLPGAAFREASLGVEDVGEAEPAPGESRYWFEGRDQEGPNNVPADSFSFATTTRIARNLALPGFLKQVTYQVVEQDSESTEPGFVGALPTLEDTTLLLVVTEIPIVGHPDDFGQALQSAGLDRAGLAAAARSAGFDSISWSIPVRSMNVRYFDGKEWRDAWDSRAEGRLPWSVDIRINFVAEEESGGSARAEALSLEEDPDFHRVVILPAGAGVLDEPPGFVRPDRTQVDRGRPQREQADNEQ